MLAHLATIFVTWFVVIDPPAMAPIFLTLTAGHPPEERKATALRAVTIAALILALFALTGQHLLSVIGITIPALRISGGILLLLLAREMVFARQSGMRSTTHSEDREAREREDVGTFPLAIPLLAGPAAITSSILLMEGAGDDRFLQAAVLGGMLVVLVLTYVLFISAARVMQRIGVTGINVIGRALGIILAALALQYVIDGLAAAFPALVSG